MKLQPNQAPRAASTSNATMTRTRRPARMMTSEPATAMSAAVPTSGWMATRATGTRISTLSAPKDGQPGGSGRSCRYQAHIIGTARGADEAGSPDDVQIPGAHHRDCQLHQLRGLEAEQSEIQPAARAHADMADRDDEHEQHAPARVQ